jgi:arginine exporter protein ArgO
LVGLGAVIALGADGFVVLLSPSRQARPMIALRVYCVPNSVLSIAAVWLAENLIHNSCILSTTMGFQCVDALPLMALAWAGRRYSHTRHARLSAIAL